MERVLPAKPGLAQGVHLSGFVTFIAAVQGTTFPNLTETSKLTGPEKYQISNEFSLPLHAFCL